MSGTAGPAPVIAPVSGTLDQRLQQLADSISQIKAQSSLIDRRGVVNGSDAAPGMVGEYLSATRSAVTALPLTSGTNTDVVSLPLTAGDWDVAGVAYFSAAAPTTVLLAMRAWIGIVAVTPPDGSQGGLAVLAVPAGWSLQGLTVAPLRVNATGATNTIYLGVSATGASPVSAYGTLRVRRMR